MNNGKSMSVLLSGATILLLAGSALAAQKQGSGQDRSGPVRLNSVTGNGTMITQ